jgi:hypothetical protein
MVSTSEAGMRSGTPAVCPPGRFASNFGTLLTETATPSFTTRKRSSNARFMVSVRM